MRNCPRCLNTAVIEDGYCGHCRECTLAPAIGSAPVLTRKVVALEGRLELERIPFHPPAECRHSCDMRLTPWLCGLARTEGGATNIAVLEMYLESLNGKYVRVTIEAEEQNAEISHE